VFTLAKEFACKLMRYNRAYERMRGFQEVLAMLIMQRDRPLEKIFAQVIRLAFCLHLTSVGGTTRGSFGGSGSG